MYKLQTFVKSSARLLTKEQAKQLDILQKKLVRNHPHSILSLATPAPAQHILIGTLRPLSRSLEHSGEARAAEPSEAAAHDASSFPEIRQSGLPHHSAALFIHASEPDAHDPGRPRIQITDPQQQQPHGVPRLRSTHP